MHIRRFAFPILVSLLALPLDAWGQATLYTAGDPAATTRSWPGRDLRDPAAAWRRSTAELKAWSASEFAAIGYELRASVPNPMGRDTSTATAGRWAMTVVNPAARRSTSRVRIEETPAIQGLFNAVLAVQPATGWTRPNNSLVTWTGSIDVPALVVLVHRPNPGPQPHRANAALTLRATTAAGVLTRTGWSRPRPTTTSPYVSLPFVVSGPDLFAGTTATAARSRPARPRPSTSGCASRRPATSSPSRRARCSRSPSRPACIGSPRPPARPASRPRRWSSPSACTPARSRSRHSADPQHLARLRVLGDCAPAARRLRQSTPSSRASATRRRRRQSTPRPSSSRRSRCRP